MSFTVLILYDAHGPQIEQLAKAIAEGVSERSLARPVLKHIDEASRVDLHTAGALVLGSPNWSGLTGFLKRWLDDQGDLWEEGVLQGKVGAAFTTGRGRHSGLEFTLLSLIHWMLANGMVVVGLPWSERMRLSGSYYGATAAGEVTEADLEQARALGRRVAELGQRLPPAEVPAMPEIGEGAPDFILPSTEGTLRLSEFAPDKKVVLAFYVEDSTPGCSLELASLKEEYATLEELGAEVVAISTDSMDSHQQFCDAVGGYPFPLASDVGGAVAQTYGVWDAESKRSHRAIFVLDERRTIIHAIPWYQPGNPSQLLEVFQALGLEA
ncbi:MAG: redoxin domain-containing protein [Chloroflexi bacterium]|nr:redoxin domain-containing protein [Chloroflexota bacterium]